MSGKRTATILALALAPSALPAQRAFEGTVNYTMTMSTGMTMDVVQHIKGDRMRQEMSTPMGEMIVIVDSNTGDATTLMPAQKMYMTMNMKEMAEQMGQNRERADVSVEATGERETIAGHRCEHVLISVGESQVDLCLARDLGFHLPGSGGGMGGVGRGGMGQGGGMGMPPAAEAKLREMFKDGAFPLRTTMTSAQGTMTMVATKVERKSISDDLFRIPEGYTKMGG